MKANENYTEVNENSILRRSAVVGTTLILTPTSVSLFLERLGSNRNSRSLSPGFGFILGMEIRTTNCTDYLIIRGTIANAITFFYLFKNKTIVVEYLIRGI